MSESMSPATSTPASGMNTALWPGACPSWTITCAAGPSQGMYPAPAGSAVSRPISSRSCPGAASWAWLIIRWRRDPASATAAGAAYRGTSPRARLHRT